MKSFVKKSIILIFIIATNFIYSQNNDKKPLTDSIYNKNIHSVQLKINDIALSDPIITLNTNESLLLNFDDFNLHITDYFYSVIHCDFDWKPSELWQNEYLQSLTEDRISDYKYSFGTLKNYVNFQLVFPNDKIIITKSGNYILEVYSKNNDGEKEIFFTKRFFVVEPIANIDAKINRASTSEFFQYKHEINFSVTPIGLNISSPYQEIKVAVLQNFRWDNALLNLKPYMVRNNKLEYNFTDDRNLIDGGNEFRYLNIRTLKSAIDNIKSIHYDDTLYHVLMHSDNFRPFKNYLFEKDANGNFFIETDDERDANIMADYAKVYFSLNSPAPNIEGDFYIAGRFNDWKFDESSKLKYDFKNKKYFVNILLKQGYYDYAYFFVPFKKSVGDITVVEGNHSQTVNHYNIFVYYRAMGSVYDRLIGATDLNNVN